MSMATLSPTASGRNAPGARPASPVFITEDGNPAHRVTGLSSHQNITHKKPNLAPNIVDLIAMDEDVDFEPPRLNIQFKPAEF